MAGGNTVEVNIVGKESVSSEIAKVIAALKALKDKTVKVKLDVDQKGLRKDIDKAVKKYNGGTTRTRLEVDVDPKHLRKQFNQAIKKAGNDMKADLRVDVDAKKAKKDLAIVKGLVDSIDENVDVKVSVDSKGAIAQLAAIETALAGLRGKEIDVKVNANDKGLRAVDKALKERQKKAKDVTSTVPDADKEEANYRRLSKLVRRSGERLGRELGEGMMRGRAYYDARMKDNVDRVINIPDSTRRKVANQARQVSKEIGDNLNKNREALDLAVRMRIAEDKGFFNDLRDRAVKERINIKINPMIDDSGMSRRVLDRIESQTVRIKLQSMVDDDSVQRDFSRLQNMAESQRNTIRIRTQLIPEGQSLLGKSSPLLLGNNETITKRIKERIIVDTEVIGGGDANRISRMFSGATSSVTRYARALGSVGDRSRRFGRDSSMIGNSLRFAGMGITTFADGLGKMTTGIGAAMRGIPVVGAIVRSVGKMATDSAGGGPIKALGGSFVALAAGFMLLGTVGVIGSGAIAGVAIAAHAVAGAVTGIASGVTALAGGVIAGGFIAIAAQSEQVKTAFSDLGTSVVDSMKQIAKPVEIPLINSAKMMQGAFDSMVPSMERMSQGTADLVNHLSGDLPAIASALGPALEKTFESGAKHIKAMSGALPSLVGSLGGFFDKMGSSTMMEATSRVWERMPGLINGIGSAIEGTAGAFTSMDNFMQSPNIEPFRQGISDFASEMAGTDWSAATSGISNAMNAFGTFMGDIDGADVAQIGGDIANMFADLTNVATNIDLVGMFAGVTGALEDISSAAEAASKPFGKLMDGLMGMSDMNSEDLDAITGAFEKLKDGDLGGAWDTLNNGTKSARDAHHAMNNLNEAFGRTEELTKSMGDHGPFEELGRYGEAIEKLKGADISLPAAEGVEKMSEGIERAAERLNGVDLRKVIDSQTATLEILPEIRTEGLATALTDFDYEIAVNVNSENLDAALNLKETILEVRPQVDEGALASFANAGKELAISPKISPEIDTSTINDSLAAVDAVLKASVELDTSAQNALGDSMEIFAKVIPKLEMSGLDGLADGLNNIVTEIGVDVLPKLPADAGADFADLFKGQMVKIEAAVEVGDMGGVRAALEGLSSGIDKIKLDYELDPSATAALDGLQATIDAVLGDIPDVPPLKAEIEVPTPDLPGDVKLNFAPPEIPPMPDMPETPMNLIAGDVPPPPAMPETELPLTPGDLGAIPPPPPTEAPLEPGELGEIPPPPPVKVKVEIDSGSAMTALENMGWDQLFDLQPSSKALSELGGGAFGRGGGMRIPVQPDMKPNALQQLPPQTMPVEPAAAPAVAAQTIPPIPVDIIPQFNGLYMAMIPPIPVDIIPQFNGLYLAMIPPIPVDIIPQFNGLYLAMIPPIPVDIIPQFNGLYLAMIPPIPVDIIPQFNGLYMAMIPPIPVDIIPQFNGLYMAMIPPIPVDIIPQFNGLYMAMIPPIPVDIIPQFNGLYMAMIPPIPVDIIPQFNGLYTAMIPPIPVDIIPQFNGLYSAMIPPQPMPVIPQIQGGVTIPPQPMPVIPQLQGTVTVPPTTVPVMPQLQGSVTVPPTTVAVTPTPSSVSVTANPVTVPVTPSPAAINVPVTPASHVIAITPSVASINIPVTPASHTIAISAAPAAINVPITPSSHTITITVNYVTTGDKPGGGGFAGSNGIAGFGEGGLVGSAGATGGFSVIARDVRSFIDNFSREMQTGLGKAYERLSSKSSDMLGSGIRDGLKSQEPVLARAANSLTSAVTKGIPAATSAISSSMAAMLGPDATAEGMNQFQETMNGVAVDANGFINDAAHNVDFSSIKDSMGFSISASGGGGGGGGGAGSHLKGLGQEVKDGGEKVKEDSEGAAEDIEEGADKVDGAIKELSGMTPPVLNLDPQVGGLENLMTLEGKISGMIGDMNFNAEASIQIPMPTLPQLPQFPPLNIPVNPLQIPPFVEPILQALNIPVNPPQVPQLQLPFVPPINIPVNTDIANIANSLKQLPKKVPVDAEVKSNAPAAKNEIDKLKAATSSIHTIMVRVIGDAMPGGQAGFAGAAGLAGAVGGGAAGASGVFGDGSFSKSITDMVDRIQQQVTEAVSGLGSAIDKAFENTFASINIGAHAGKMGLNVKNSVAKEMRGAAISVYDEGVLISQNLAVGIKDGNKTVIRALDDVTGSFNDVTFFKPEALKEATKPLTGLAKLFAGFKFSFGGLFKNIFDEMKTNMSAGYLNEFGQMVVYNNNEVIHMNNNFDGGLVGDTQKQGKRVIEVLNEYHTSRKTSAVLGATGAGL